MRTIRTWIRPLAAIAMLASVAHAWQHSYTPADIDAGAKLYDSSCGRCHGENGDSVQGVNFNKSQFKTVRSDEDIVRIIQKGVPNAGMPPSPYSDAQAGTLVAYLRSMPGGSNRNALLAAAAGNADRGKAIVEGKGNCLGCHKIGTAGTGLVLGPLGGPRGPDLAQIERSLLEPNAELAGDYRIYRVVTRAGKTVTGTVLNRDTFTVQLRDSEGNLRSFINADLKEAGYVPSPMPSYKDKLTAQEVADVVSYLITLR